MGEKMIYIPLDEYREMCIMQGKYEAIKAHIESCRYSLDKEYISILLGLEVKADE